MRAERRELTSHGLVHSQDVMSQLIADSRTPITDRLFFAISSAAAAPVAMPGFEVTFDRVASFPGEGRSQPLVLLGNDGVVALTALQRTLRQALEAAGLPAASKGGYKPHVT